MGGRPDIPLQCAMANKRGSHSVALAQALQFEGKLPQKRVLGEWVPQTERGLSDLFVRDQKWLPGLLAMVFIQAPNHHPAQAISAGKALHLLRSV
jgi:hypothetical protein